ncbi:MBL fold metallo-hydrolase [Actinokineospora iranica]|uniref:L-ascorbate metabolism protein UlaG, beta-lactamase superfamily n=1 Tax=Actinokineospora iranica TaxID=1271860 RepID=A0A1G6WCH5_9PSEU|nr:MBL fold metallo-hydrolase [Actinokineospora iranica]SDD62746.1 L-ascorbate metabolism protein UlaG, beta-lactamase superfamily [Actinokineospora iranica]
MRRSLAAIGLAAAAAWAVREVPAAVGGKARGDRAERISRSPQFHDGAFRNRAKARPVPPGAMRDILREMLFGGVARKPSAPVPLVPPGPPADRAEGLRITWHGHATTLVEIDGARVLFDPVWSKRVSPSRRIGPRRLHKPPVPLADLPRVDAVVISHDHYDHLDMATIRALADAQETVFVVPLGVGAHLERWKVPGARIVELDWSQETEVAGVRLVATPAQHFSGRTLTRDDTLWASWVVAGPTRKVFYTGDSGYFDGYARIGAEHGPFDAALVQIGAYSDAWPDIHMTPEEGVAAHIDVRGGLLIPVHWATFTLAVHSWTDPVDRVWAEAKAREVPLAVPRPGECVDVDNPPPVDPWWQTLA